MSTLFRTLACLLLIFSLQTQAAAQDKQPAANKYTAAPPPVPSLGTTYEHINPIMPRYQWENNNGYCGETSLIQSGMYYGQYLSQYDVRAIASKHQGGAYQLLLGVQDAATAQALRLTCDSLKTLNTESFLSWAKAHVIAGHPVIIGVMNNEYLFYQYTNPDTGSQQYDHIVTIVGWGSNNPLSQKKVYDDDVILIEDHGVYAQNTVVVPDSTVQYWFPLKKSYFLGSRQLANDKNDPNRVYTLLNLPSNQYKGKAKNSVRYNYGLAITGIADQAKETLPVRVVSNINYQVPVVAHTKKDITAPDAHEIVLSVTISGLKSGVNYQLYRYSNNEQVPRKSFNQNSGNPFRSFTAATSSQTFQFVVKDNEQFFFRAVPASGN